MLTEQQLREKILELENAKQQGDEEKIQRILKELEDASNSN